MPKHSHIDVATTVELPKLDKVELGNFALDIDYFLKTDYQDAHSAAKEIPSVVEWINSELQIAIEKKIMSKQDVKKEEGAAFLDLRGALWERRGYAGKQTESAIDAAVQQEKPVIEAHRTLAYWSGLTSRLSNTLISLQSKLDLVRTSEATRRAMVEADPDKNED